MRAEREENEMQIEIEHRFRRAVARQTADEQTETRREGKNWIRLKRIEATTPDRTWCKKVRRKEKQNTLSMFGVLYLHDGKFVQFQMLPVCVEPLGANIFLASCSLPLARALFFISLVSTFSSVQFVPN